MEEEAEKLKEMQGEVEKQLMSSKPGQWEAISVSCYYSWFLVVAFIIVSLSTYNSNTWYYVSNSGRKNGFRQ